MNKIKKIIEKNKYLIWLLIFTNWVYQGIPQSDKTEKIYKISFTLSFWVIFYFVLFITTNLTLVYSLTLSLILAHTLNWFLNCNHFVIFVHRIKWLKTSKEELFKHLSSIQKKIKNKKWILFSISLGGISRGTMSEHSDIDVNIIRKPGFKNGIYAVLFAAMERNRADFHGIPLDIMISDSFEDITKKTNGQNNPVIMHDPYQMIDKYYKEKMSIKEAQKLNNVNIE